MNERTVMLVDDDVSFLKNMKAGLEYSIKNIKVITHTNAEDAWKSLGENDVSLLITDQKMPGMSGIELVSLVDKKFPAIPIIFITAYGTPNLKYRAMDTGAIKFFDKPIDLKEMIKEVEKGLKLSKDDLTSIKKMSLATVLELISMEKKNASVVVKSEKPNKNGRIWFREGNLIDAEVDNLEGIEAVFEMLSYGNVDIVIREREHERVTISDVSLEYVLLEGMKRLDEKKAKEAEKGSKTKKFDDEIEKENLALEKLDRANKILKKELGKGLLAANIFTINGNKTLVSYNSSSKIGKVFNEMTQKLNEYLNEMKLPSINKHYIMDLEDNKTLIIMAFKEYRWAILVDSRELKLGLLVNLVLPNIIELI
ncbi:response regulator [candidate division WOR-3 bacterium]|nr:response regulator [candidate division WOR-3 bacterium]